MILASRRLTAAGRYSEALTIRRWLAEVTVIPPALSSRIGNRGRTGADARKPAVPGMRPMRVQQDGTQWPPERECANCGIPLTGPDAVASGPPIAWHHHCRACAELVADQLEEVADQPGNARIRIYQCRRCGSARSCRPGWLTRCHVCLDERSTGLHLTDAASSFLRRLAGDRALRKQTQILTGKQPV